MKAPAGIIKDGEGDNDEEENYDEDNFDEDEEELFKVSISSYNINWTIINYIENSSWIL